MVIISHRGHWSVPEEQNKLPALQKAITLGFGLEMDLRDYAEDLVISHNMARDTTLALDQFLQWYHDFGGHHPPLALNIKADGLCLLLKEALGLYQVENYFVFDMSIPDAILYLNLGLNVFTRQSEYEETPNLYKNSKGVWLDEFEHHWITDEILIEHLENDKQVCIVSPELHGRSFKMEWQQYRKFERRHGRDRLMICTDHPVKAEEFFN